MVRGHTLLTTKCTVTNSEDINMLSKPDGINGSPGDNPVLDHRFLYVWHVSDLLHDYSDKLWWNQTIQGHN
eukprot:jgi/Psemu1/43459/gm1.43459_g